MLTAVTPDVPVTDFRQVGAGAYWHWNSLARAATNRRLFNGDFSSLVEGRSKTARNGLALILRQWGLQSRRIGSRQSRVSYIDAAVGRTACTAIGQVDARACIHGRQCRAGIRSQSRKRN